MLPALRILPHYLQKKCQLLYYCLKEKGDVFIDIPELFDYQNLYEAPAINQKPGCGTLP